MRSVRLSSSSTTSTLACSLTVRLLGLVDARPCHGAPPISGIVRPSAVDMLRSNCGMRMRQVPGRQTGHVPCAGLRTVPRPVTASHSQAEYNLGDGRSDARRKPGHDATAVPRLLFVSGIAVAAIAVVALMAAACCPSARRRPPWSRSEETVGTTPVSATAAGCAYPGRDLPEGRTRRGRGHLHAADHRQSFLAPSPASRRRWARASWSRRRATS